MTLPNGSGGINPALQFGVSVGSSIQNLPTRTQDAVADILKAEVQISAAWNAATAAVFEGLRRGISLSLAIIEAIVQKLFNIVTEFPGVSEAIDAINEVPAVQALVAALTGISGDLADLETYVAGKWNTLATVVSDIADFIAAAGQTAIADVGGAIVAVTATANDAAADLAALISAVSGTVIADVSTAITTAQSDAASAISQLDALIAGVSGIHISDVITAINTAFSNANDAVSDLSVLLIGMSATDIHSLVTGFLATANNADNAVADLASLITGILGGGHTIADLVAYLNAIPGTAISGITAIEQNIIDAIANALGHAGTGHTVSDIATYLANIPGSVISGVTTAGQSLIDTIANALGVTGTGHATAAVGTALGAIPGGNLTGALNTALTVSGTTLSTLVTDINNAIAQLLQLFSNFGAAFPITFPFTFGTSTNLTLAPPVALSEFKQLLDGIAGQANASVAQAVGALQQSVAVVQSNVSQAIVDGVNAVNTEATAVASAVNGVASAAIDAGITGQGLIAGVNNAAAGVAAGASQLLADAQENLLLMLGAAPLYLQGLAGSFGQTATNNAYAAAAAARATQAAEQARITSAFNAVFNVNPVTSGNVSVTTDFTAMADALTMTGMMSPGNTHMGITSGAAAHQAGAIPNTFDTEVFPTQTVTDYQVITATLGPLNEASGHTWTFLIGRVNSTRDTYVFAQIIAGYGVVLGAAVSGSLIGVASAAVPTMSTGGTVKLVLGDPSSSSPYAIQVLYNGTPILTYTDSSHISQLGSSYRYVGLSMATLYNSTEFPPAIRTVAYQDNPPPPTSYPHSGRPTAGTKGRLWAPNDVGLIQRDNSAAWETIWAGALGALTDPPSTSWSWVNQGAATTATELGGERVTSPTSTRSWRLRTRTLTPSSNYTATAHVESAAKAGGAYNWYSGIGLRDSASGSFITWGPCYSNFGSIYTHVGVIRWTDTTTASAISANTSTYQIAGGAAPNWYRIRDDGSNRYFEFSVNGVDWITYFSESRTAFITPDQFCFGASNEGSGADHIVRLRSLTGIS